MTEQHPITPPPELVQQWMKRTEYDEHTWFYESYIAEQAARWGADQELEACCEWLPSDLTIDGESLRDVRRPKLPSLKEQALAELDQIPTHDNEGRTVGVDVSIIRRALETLND